MQGKLKPHFYMRQLCDSVYALKGGKNVKKKKIKKKRIEQESFVVVEFRKSLGKGFGRNVQAWLLLSWKVLEIENYNPGLEILWKAKKK